MQDVKHDRSGSPPPELHLVPPRRGLLREDVYTHLRDQIIAGVLAPGERLRGPDLARELGVSRTPVREALRRLQDAGLVETWANRWTRVAPIDLAEADRLYPLIWALERLAVLEAQPLSPERLEALIVANRDVSTALGEHDAISASEADRAFHQVLIDAWGNPELARILDELKLRLQRFEFHYFRGSLLAERSVIEHQAIVDALAESNRVGAADAVEENWRRSLERLRRRTA